MANLTNATLWDAIRKYSPQFAARTAKGTAVQFTEVGYDDIDRSDPSLFPEFMRLSFQFVLQQIRGTDLKDRLLEGDFGEIYSQPYGGIAQRILVGNVIPATPAWKNLVNGQSIDPFIINLPEQTERFFQQNFDFQAWLTVPDRQQFKVAFINPENGFATLLGVYMTALENSYRLQRYQNKLEAINAGLNSGKNPLKETQIIEVSVADKTNPTEAELVDIILAIKNVITAMTTATVSTAFNSIGHGNTQDVSRLRILMRKGWKNLINTKVLSTIFNPDKLNLDVDIIEMDNFGGLVPYSDSEFATRVYPVYNTAGQVIGFNQNNNATEATLTADDVFWKDPNENVLAIIADKGWMFETEQNPFEVETIYNPRGKYMNYWASSMNNGIHIDASYNIVAVKFKTV